MKGGEGGGSNWPLPGKTTLKKPSLIRVKIIWYIFQAHVRLGVILDNFSNNFFYVNKIIVKNNIIIENIKADLPTFYNTNIKADLPTFYNTKY